MSCPPPPLSPATVVLLGVFSPRRFQNAESEDPVPSNKLPEQNYDITVAK